MKPGIRNYLSSSKTVTTDKEDAYFMRMCTEVLGCERGIIEPLLVAFTAMKDISLPGNPEFSSVDFLC